MRKIKISGAVEKCVFIKSSGIFLVFFWSSRIFWGVFFWCIDFLAKIKKKFLSRAQEKFRKILEKCLSSKINSEKICRKIHRNFYKPSEIFFKNFKKNLEPKEN